LKVLVIGGTGLVGSSVAREVERAGGDAICLSRSGTAPHGRGVRGDVTIDDLGLGDAAARGVLDGLTHVVSCFGSVAWSNGPGTATRLHAAGTRNVLRFAARSPTLERVVHVSSVLALGRATGRVGNEHLDVGQTFRNWYEVGKFLAEREVRYASAAMPVRSVRVGPVLGTVGPVIPRMRDGVLAVLPYLLRGYPLHLDKGGEFPCYPCDASALGGVLLRAATAAHGPTTWTWYDDRRPSLRTLFDELCAAWGCVPRIVDLRTLSRFNRVVATRLGLPKAVVDYDRPWVDIPDDVMLDLLGDLPRCAEGYLRETGERLRAA
jgi:nucleoside-diphosphate-sugar epimerase